MAAETKARHNKFAAPMFTLPISCQICLGKVKQPVLCPNHHVFCAYCMEIWLERNQQCPACRVPINETNPVKHIKGGLNQPEDEKIDSSMELRRTRFNLLFREYEDELERLQEEARLLKTENGILKTKLNEDATPKCVQLSSSKSGAGSIVVEKNDRLLLLTKKLQDVQKLYDKVKQDIGKYKQENGELKDENINLVRENAKLREEIAHRSPYRYGRYTVATLESQLETQQKEVAQLKKALECSDQYIEKLEHQIQCSQGGVKHSTPKANRKKIGPKKGNSHSSGMDLVHTDSKVFSDINKPIVSVKNEINQQKHCVGSGQPVARQLFGEDPTYDRKKSTECSDVRVGVHHPVSNSHSAQMQFENQGGSDTQIYVGRACNGLPNNTHDIGFQRKNEMVDVFPEKLRIHKVDRTNHTVCEDFKTSERSWDNFSTASQNSKGSSLERTTKSVQSWHTISRHPNIQQLFKESGDAILDKGEVPVKESVKDNVDRKASKTQDFDSLYDGICKKYGLNPEISHHAVVREKVEPEKELPESIMKKPEPGIGNVRERSPGKRVQFDLKEKNSDNASSFDLEMPSPLASSFVGKLSVDSEDISVESLQAAASASSNPGDVHFSRGSRDSNRLAGTQVCSRDRHSLPAFLSERSDDRTGISHPSKASFRDTKFDLPRNMTEDMETGHVQDPPSEFQSISLLSGLDVDTPQSLTEEMSGHNRPDKAQSEKGSFDLDVPGLDDTQTIQTELSDLDISVTPELTDCLKLLNRAERKIHQSDVMDIGRTPGSDNIPQQEPFPSRSAVVQKAISLEQISVHGGGLETGCIPPQVHSKISSTYVPSTYVPGIAGTLSGWEHGFFSSLRVNPFRHGSTLNQQLGGYQGGYVNSGNAAGWTNPLLSDAMVNNGRAGFSVQNSRAMHADTGTANSQLPKQQEAGNSLAEKLFALPGDADGEQVLPRLGPSASADFSACAGSARQSNFLPAASTHDQEKVTGTSVVTSHGLVGGSRSTSVFGLDLPQFSGKSAYSNFEFPGKQGSGNYSYVSDASSMVEGSNTKPDDLSFLPEPKKRLFDSDDDMDLSSPSKTTKIF